MEKLDPKWLKSSFVDLIDSTIELIAVTAENDIDYRNIIMEHASNGQRDLIYLYDNEPSEYPADIILMITDCWADVLEKENVVANLKEMLRVLE